MPNTVLETITVGGTTYDLPSGGSGMTSHIIVISDAGSTVTVTLPSGTVKTCTQVSGSTTQWETTSDEYGIHTIDAVKDGDDAQTTLNITMVGEYVVHDEHFTYTINVTAMSGSTIVVSGGSETYTGTGTGSALAFVVHGKNTTYTISVTVDGVSKTDSVTTGSTSGQSSSVTIQFGTINVTYENDFKGVSITCTLGATTITKTAPTTGNTMSFYPPTTGQWTISGTVSGTSYSTTANITSLSTPVSVNLQTIPDGSTATPTDVVQTWLKCAGINDKAYTTVAQVLGDSTTLLALISDNNAADYMVRSTTWASDVCADSTAMTDIGANNYCADTLLADVTWCNAICNSAYIESVLNVKVPTMTSNTTPSGSCFHNSPYESREPYTAFTGTQGIYQNTSPWQVGYMFTSPVAIKCVKYMGRTTSSPTPDLSYYLAFTMYVEGSNDGSTYNSVHTRKVTKAEHGATASGSQTIGTPLMIPMVSSDTAYSYWRVRSGSNNYNYNSTSDWGLLQFYGREDV